MEKKSVNDDDADNQHFMTWVDHQATIIIKQQRDILDRFMIPSANT